MKPDDPALIGTEGEMATELPVVAPEKCGLDRGDRTR
jgi:hypothetical protein